MSMLYLPQTRLMFVIPSMLQMPNVMPDQADTYKCFAVNEYGQAVVTVVLNVIEGENPFKTKYK